LLWRRGTRKRIEKLVMEVLGIAICLVVWVVCLGGILYFLRRWSPLFRKEEDKEWNKTASFLTWVALLQFSHFTFRDLLIRPKEHYNQTPRFRCHLQNSSWRPV
jgi:hypothetical protein